MLLNLLKFFSKFQIVLTLCFLPFLSFAQDDAKDTKLLFQYNIKKSNSKIVIDGEEGIGEWDNLKPIQQTYNHSPSDEGLAKNRSEIRLTHDDQKLYIIAKLYDNGTRVVQSLQRDSDDAIWQSDSFVVVLDPINKKQSGFLFGVNAGGAEYDGSLLVQPSGTDYSPTWDLIWTSKTKQYDGYWIVEYAIPLSSLGYNKGNLEWGINFIRRDMNENFFYTWTQFPLNFSSVDVNYMGVLLWGEIPDVKTKSIFIKPYTALSTSKNNLAEDRSTETEFNAGGDIKIGITKSINADITFNPDFSNADVDDEVTNITRFNIFLPERREFFTENADIFSNFGNSISPFFSRRIGLVNGQSIPIVYGVRTTGNLTDDLRLGAMNVQTKREDDIDPQNNTVAAVNYKVFGRSQIKALFINRQGEDNDYGRNFGAEYTFISKKGNLNTTARFHKSYANDENSGQYYAINGNYYTRSLGTGWNVDVVNKDYNADLGFTPRLFNFDAENQVSVKRTYTSLNPWVRYRFYTKKPESKVIYHAIRTWNYWYLNGDGSLNERENNIAYDLRLKNTSAFTATVSARKVNLLFQTNFLGSDFDNLPIDSYTFTNGSLHYRSDSRKRFRYSTTVNYGEFYNGTKLTLNTSVNLRYGNWGNFSLSYNYNNINLPNNYGDVELNLIKLKSLLSFTNTLSLNNTVQYNSQSTNFSVFSRLQWRYSPLSDIFLIYNQNNNTEGFDLRNRSIILKMTHRFGV